MTGTEGTVAAEARQLGRAVLSARNLRKVYGGAVALADGNLDVAPAEIHALVGENGAGKTTLIRCIAGTPPPDAGSITVGDAAFPQHHTPADAAAAGLAFIHQDAALVDELSVAENIALTAGYGSRLRVIDWRSVHRTARHALDRMAVELETHSLVAELPPATRMIVAIARALVGSPRVLVLDEPTANLSASDVARLFGILRGLRDSGAGIVYVSHRLDEVEEICDRITVVRDGFTVGSVRTQDVSKRELVRMICGREVDVSGARAVRSAEVVLDVAELSGPFLEPISFELGSGEIAGFTGMSDAGHYVLGELLFGLLPRARGKTLLLDTPYEPSRPADAIARGVAYIPPDRNMQGLARELTLRENLFMNPDPEPSSVRRVLQLMRTSTERRDASAILHRFHVVPPRPDERVSALSGGNAQKVLVARWLRQPPTLLIVSDLTVGVDVGARAEIYEQIRQIAARGAAVMVISSDFEEVEALCSRAFVLQRGRLIATLEDTDVTQEQITARAVVGARE
jgi:ABC-type sugar transport system ATPase subunit